MHKTLASLVSIALLAGTPMLTTNDARAAGEISCNMSFSLAGWSAFYKTSSGTGTITCSNGRSLHVRLASKGGGLTFGKLRIAGIGKFSGIYDINETLGSYVNAEVHAGAVRSAHSTVMTKGNVSLALSGKGTGWNIGVDFGKFTISTDR